ncbi:hypothetical protein ACB092_11G072600 [Castanea dentata]
MGPIPSDGVLLNFTGSFFVGNRSLCGKQINVTCKDDAGGPGTNSQSPTSAQAVGVKKKYSGRLLISASATVGALLLVALMCFWGCFLYKKFGKNDGQSLAMDVSGGVPRIQDLYLQNLIMSGASIVMFHGDLPYSSKDIIKKLTRNTCRLSPWVEGQHVARSSINRETNEKVAIKKINNVFENRIDALRTLRELKLLRHIRHENVIALKDVMMPIHRTSFKDVYLVYEVMDTDLHHIIKSSQPLSGAHCKYFLFQDNSKYRFEAGFVPPSLINFENRQPRDHNSFKMPQDS